MGEHQRKLLLTAVECSGQRRLRHSLPEGPKTIIFAFGRSTSAVALMLVSGTLINRILQLDRLGEKTRLYPAPGEGKSAPPAVLSR